MFILRHSNVQCTRTQRGSSSRNYTQSRGLELTVSALIAMSFAGPSTANADTAHNIANQSSPIVEISQTNPIVVMKLLVNAMSQLLDTSAAQSMAMSSSLSTDAANFNADYAAFGIRSNLTSQEISNGTQDCIDALKILNDPGVDLGLTAALEADLRSSVSSLLTDLGNARVH